MSRHEFYEYFCPEHNFPLFGHTLKQLYLRLVIHLAEVHKFDEIRAKMEAKERLKITFEDLE